MSNEAAKTPAAFRISELLDAGSFVEISGAVMASSTISTCRKKSSGRWGDHRIWSH